MEQRRLGNSGLVVSRTALGTMMWGLDSDEDEAQGQARAFLDAGGTLIDTADVYADGDSERMIGRLLRGSTAHLHVPRVSVREHAAELRRRLAGGATTTFRALTSDCSTTLEVVARFLALLDLHTRGAVSLEQLTALGELHVRWTAAADDAGSEAGLEWDEQPAAIDSEAVRDDGPDYRPA